MSSEINPIKELGDFLGVLNYRSIRGRVTLMDGYWEKDGAYYMATVVKAYGAFGGLTIDMDTLKKVPAAEVDFKALHEDLRRPLGE